jgi:hypothetical protein
VKVICSLPNAARLISGIAFSEHNGKLRSEAVDEAIARKLASIPGYEIDQMPEADAPKPARRARTSKPAI